MIEQEKRIKDFLTQIAKQNNRGTAFPYFYVIRTARWVSSYCEGEGDRVIAIHDGETAFIGEDEGDIIKAYRKHLKEDYPDEYGEVKDLDDWELKSHMEDKEYSFYWENKEWEEKNMFLTDKEAKEHLRLNHYHYSKDAHTYVKHCWRAPELYNFMKSLFKYFEIESGNLNIRD